eukprot:10395136-Heterocapsa_arctica.AAC.1
MAWLPAISGRGVHGPRRAQGVLAGLRWGHGAHAKDRRIITSIARRMWSSSSDTWEEELRMGHGVLLWKGKGDKKNLDSH